MRKAAHGWENDYRRRFVKLGFIVGKSAPTVMAHPKKELTVVVHGDDFTFLGPELELKWIEGEMRKWYEIKMRGVLGPESGDVKKIDILNRTLDWKHDGIENKADDKHASILIDEIGLKVGFERGGMCRHEGEVERRG